MILQKGFSTRATDLGGRGRTAGALGLDRRAVEVEAPARPGASAGPVESARTAR
jgi:hypothetical protein